MRERKKQPYIKCGYLIVHSVLIKDSTKDSFTMKSALIEEAS